MPTKLANGNSSDRLEYRFNTAILTDAKYYRLKQMNLSGDMIRSNIIRLAEFGKNKL